METTWATAPLTLIPVFTGPQECGHWSGLIVDRVRIPNIPLQIYQDSLSPSTVRQSSHNLQSSLAGTPLAEAGTQWVTSQSPVQAKKSNDCAVCTCLRFAAYLKAMSDGCIFSGSHGTLRGNVTLTTTLQEMTPTEWGQRAHRHMLESFRNDRINLNDPVITSLLVRFNT